MRKSTFIVCALLATACTTKSWYGKELASIDSLYYSVDTSIVALARIDTLPYRELSRRYSQNANFVEAYYAQRDDTIGRDVALIMADYRELKKPYSRYVDEYYRVEKELHFTKNQLATLKHDLENNLLDSTVVKRIMREEREAAVKVIDQTKALIISNAITKLKTAAIEPRIDSLIKAMKER